jgi:hypothetical protein
MKGVRIMMAKTKIIKNGFLAQPSQSIQFCNIIPRNGQFGKGIFKKFLGGESINFQCLPFFRRPATM